MKIIYSKSRRTLEKKAVSLIKSKILKLSKRKKRIVIGIPGGRSVKGIYSLLSKQKLPWENLHIFFVDERSIPISSKDSNYHLASKYFKYNIHPYNFRLPHSSYTKLFLSHQKFFDIALLGMGEDGHCASLFPDHPSIKNKSKYFISVSRSPKPPKNRISASLSLISKSKTTILLAFGKEKSQALKNFKNPKLSITQCPSKLIRKIKDSHLLTNIK